jgi:uncharacterized protein with beta-barrel porin domain
MTRDPSDARRNAARTIPLPAAIAGFALNATAQAQAPTQVPSGGTVTLASGADIGPALLFGTGGGGDATLAITGGGLQLFSGTWQIDGSNAVFDLAAGVELVMQPGRTGGVVSTPSDLVLRGGGTLVLGPNAYLSGWQSALAVQGAGTQLQVGERAWLTSASRLTIGTGATLRYFASDDATVAGTLVVGDGAGGRGTLDVSSLGTPTGSLTFTGTVQGTSDLRIRNSAGLASPTSVTLGFAQGSYDGNLVLDGARVRLDNARGIGTDGIEVITTSKLTLGNSMTTGAGQSMLLDADLQLQGSTGTQQLTWNGDIVMAGADTLTIESMQLSMASTSDLTGAAGAIELAGGGILSLNGATAEQRVLGNGGLLSGPGTVGQLGDAGGFVGTIQLGNGSSPGTLQTTGSAFVANAFIESLLFAGTGTADSLVAGALLDGVDQASIDLIYDATVSGGPLVPATGSGPVSYTILSGLVVADATPGQLALTIIDPLNGQFTVQNLSTTGTNFDSSGVQFEWIATDGAGGSGVFRITGAPSPTIAGGGSTSTNIGTVSNVTIRNAVDSVNSIMQLPGQTPDGQYVGTSLLLLSPSVLPGAVVTAAVPGNPDALPNTMFDSMSQAGQVARLRLMQLRDGGMGDAAARVGGGVGAGASGANDTGSYQCSLTQATPSADVVSQPLAIGAGINGGSPQSGARVWARGYGFSSSVNGQSYAQGDYSAAMGGVMVGADASLDGGLLAGAFVGYTPGSLTIDSTLGNTQTSLNGVSFGGYASWSPEDGRCYAQGYAMAGYNDADQTRNVQIPGLVRTATSSADVWGAMVGGEGGLNLDLGDAATLQPYVGLEYGYYTRGGYSESGAGSLNLTVSGQDANLLQPTAGARVMKTFGLGEDRLTPYLGAAFVAQVPLGSWSESATNGFSGAQVFTFSEGADDQYGASFEAGLEFANVGGWTAYVSFNGLAMTDTTVFGGQLGINLSF